MTEFPPCRVRHRPERTASAQDAANQALVLNRMREGQTIATLDHGPGGIDAVLEFLKRTRAELRTLCKVRVWPDRLQVVDVNEDRFEVRGLGYQDADIVRALDMVNAAYNRGTVHQPTEQEYKEFRAGRRYAWAADRVM